MVNYAKLRGLMAERGMEINKLAEILGVSRQTASNKVNGKTGISITDAIQIAEALNMTSEERDMIFFSACVKSDATKEAKV